MGRKVDGEEGRMVSESDGGCVEEEWRGCGDCERDGGWIKRRVEEMIGWLGRKKCEKVGGGRMVRGRDGAWGGWGTRCRMMGGCDRGIEVPKV